MATKHFTFGPIKVTVTDRGAGIAPWDEKSAERTEYDVHVGSYRTKAWGSINSYKQGKLDHEAIGAMVVDELQSAAVNPDEFIELSMGGSTGREALDRGRAAEKTIKAAQNIGEEGLTEAVEDIREKGLD